jgi:hypothetical protein
MKMYYRNEITDFEDQEALFKYAKEGGLEIQVGTILTIKLLNRFSKSNKGKALEGAIQIESSKLIKRFRIENGLDDDNPNYISFLDDYDCQKKWGLYKIRTLVGRDLVYLIKDNNLEGYIPFEKFI